jgi:hypothetical protein
MPGPDAAAQMLSAEQVARLLAAAQRRPQLADIPWHDDEAVFDGAPPRRSQSSPTPAGAAQALDPVRRRIRDRYISVRFAGVARGAADLENPTRVIKAAWLCLEEREPHAALELLALAIEQAPRDAQLRLAQVELAYRLGERAAFVAAARAFREAFPASREWPEMARLGRRLAPGDAFFLDASGTGGSRDDGAEPSWIEPPWQGLPGLDAAEFHRAMMQEDGRGH